ncbi:MAG: THUMP domain-containing protein, partial [Planctomycetota bacterium]|nr:THUMP domain-containing protein [Planctomycetota bacterium]
MVATIEYYAPCSLGMEDVLHLELDALGASRCREMRGGVAFCGDRAFGYKANLWLRTAIRVQEKVFQGKVRDDDELYNLVQRVDWSRYMSVDQTLAIDASVRDSAITHSQYAARKCKDAIVDQFRDRLGKRPNVDTSEPDLPLKITVLGNVATIYLNLSGDSLHKRGWRPIQVKSPLNEALAAGLLIMSRWDQRSPIVDPMCGSGTFLIEAACMATDRAPGLGRMFPFETWPDFEEAAWRELRADAESRIVRVLDFPIEGSDRHAGAISLAKKSAEAAGVHELIEFTVADARRFQPSVPPVAVVVNPPYGERLGEGDDLLDTWDALGNFFHEQCRGAMAHVL